MTETLVAGVAQEIAQHARVVIMIDAKGLVHLLLEADGADAILSSQHGGIAFEGDSVLSFEVLLASVFAARNEFSCPILGIRRISVSFPLILSLLRRRQARWRASSFSINSGFAAYLCFLRAHMRRFFSFEDSPMRGNLLVKPNAAVIAVA
jgi:hypothetical protein